MSGGIGEEVGGARLGDGGRRLAGGAGRSSSLVVVEVEELLLGEW